MTGKDEIVLKQDKRQCQQIAMEKERKEASEDLFHSH